MKKSLTIALLFILVLPLVLAQGEKISIETSQENYEPGQKVSVKISLLDSSNKQINDQIQITLEDAERRKKVEQTITSNQFVDIDLGESATHGFWTITANYKDSKATSTFTIEIQELAKFEIIGDKLKITNIGNTKYSRTIQILIGETAGIKEPQLEIGESVTYRLIAPEGTYNIKITDGQTSITQGNVALTGRVIGILDESVTQPSGITGGIKPEEDSNLIPSRNNLFIYIFVVAVVGAMILLAIERRYTKKAS